MTSAVRPSTDLPGASADVRHGRVATIDDVCLHPPGHEHEPGARAAEDQIWIEAEQRRGQHGRSLYIDALPFDEYGCLNFADAATMRRLGEGLIGAAEMWNRMAGDEDVSLSSEARQIGSGALASHARATETVLSTAPPAETSCPDWCAGHDSGASTSGADANGWITPLVKGDMPYRWHRTDIGAVRLSMIEEAGTRGGAMSMGVDIVDDDFTGFVGPDAVEALARHLMRAAAIMRGSTPAHGPEDVDAAVVANVQIAAAAGVPAATVGSNDPEGDS